MKKGAFPTSTPSARLELALYYHDLADPNAKITDRIDGKPVTPTDGNIVFPDKGMHFLQIEIEETPDRKWEIEYKLNVD